MYRFRYFTEVRARYIKIDDLRFIHGDLINKRDFWYFLMRAGIRNPVVELIVRAAGPTFGPKLIRRIDDYLHKATANSPHRHNFPEGQMMKYLKRQERFGAKRIFAGHFHQQNRRETETGASIDLIPAFFMNQEISLYDVEADCISTDVWQNLLADKQ